MHVANTYCHGCLVPYFVVYDVLACIMHTHVLVLIRMYNVHPYFSLRNGGKKVCIIKYTTVCLFDYGHLDCFQFFYYYKQGNYEHSFLNIFVGVHIQVSLGQC